MKDEHYTFNIKSRPWN